MAVCVSVCVYVCVNTDQSILSFHHVQSGESVPGALEHLLVLGPVHSGVGSVLLVEPELQSHMNDAVWKQQQH